MPRFRLPPPLIATPRREAIPKLPQRRLNRQNLSFLLAGHALAIAAIAYLASVRCSWQTLALGLSWYVCCGLSITAGYHRLLSHRAYRTTTGVLFFFLLFGAASVQNSALRWCGAHRRHHRHTDRPGDPYDITRGFFWAHIGWVVDPEAGQVFGNVSDLERNSLIGWQHRNYPALALAIGALLPACIGALWNDAIGALLVAGFLRLVIQWHATFAVNSLAHTFGARPYTCRVSARDNVLVSLMTFGEGYHNFHHRFPTDYRNGARWYHYDPTKWCIWVLSKLGLAWQLRRAPRAVLQCRPTEDDGQMWRKEPSDACRVP